MAIIIANWKMHFTLQEANDFCLNLNKISTSNKLIIAPPVPYLSYLTNKFSKINFASQNVSIYSEYGSYTGEYSADILKTCGVKYVMIGHAERRKLFNENNDEIGKKILNTSRTGLIPIICIGEPLDIRQSRKHEEYIIRQLDSINIKNQLCIIAYEPIWSIGSEQNPIDRDLAEIFKFIKNYLRKADIVNNVQLVYGGSVTLENIKQILSIKNIDGVLVGRSSLSYQNLDQIIKLCEQS